MAFNSCVHTHEFSHHCICVICRPQWNRKTVQEQRPIMGISARVHHNCMRCQCAGCLQAKQSSFIYQIDGLGFEPNGEPISKKIICNKCPYCIKHTWQYELTSLRPHFDTCPCNTCKTRRLNHKTKLFCECSACERASFGRCTAKLFEIIVAATNISHARRENRRRRIQDLTSRANLLTDNTELEEIHNTLNFMLTESDNEAQFLLDANEDAAIDDEYDSQD